MLRKNFVLFLLIVSFYVHNLVGQMAPGKFQFQFIKRVDYNIPNPVRDKALTKSAAQVNRLECFTMCSLERSYMISYKDQFCQCYNELVLHAVIKESSTYVNYFRKDEMFFEYSTMADTTTTELADTTTTELADTTTTELVDTTTTELADTTTTELADTVQRIHHWPIVNGLTEDIIGGANIINSVGSWVADRLNVANSALSLSHSSILSLPAREYFDPATGGFTITAWLYHQCVNTNAWLSIVTFGPDSTDADDIILGLESGSTNTFYLKASVADGAATVSLLSSAEVVKNVWTHVAMSVDTFDNKLRIFLNGVLKGTTENAKYNKILRDVSVIGGIHGIFDDLRIFDRRLTEDEILADMDAN